jgi:hypothetical protein
MPKNLPKYLLRGGLIVFCGTLFSAQTASASPILWNLVGVTFGDGGTASGSFAYDAVTNTYSSINITTTTGSRVAGATYLVLDPALVSFLDAVNLIVVPNAGPYDHSTPLLFLAFNPPLTVSGGTVSFITGLSSVEGTCSDPGCGALNFQGTPFRLVSAGSVSVAPVPEPSSISLGLAAAFALCLGGRLRRFVQNSWRLEISGVAKVRIPRVS